MRRLITALLLVGLAVSLPGCATLRDLFNRAFQKPDLRFKTLKLQNISLGGADVDTVWTLRNPNPIGLSLAEVDYTFFVEGKQLVAGAPREGLRIPERGSTDLVFPTNVKFQELVPALAVFLNQDSAKYRAEGHIGVQTPIGVIKFPLKKEGTFEVPKIPTMTFETPRITHVTLSGATLEIPLRLTNRNSFPLPIGGLVGNVSIGGAKVGNVSSGNLGLLQGRGSQTVTLPVTVNFASALSAATAIRQGKGTVALTGNLNSGGTAVPVSLSELESFIR